MVREEARGPSHKGPPVGRAKVDGFHAASSGASKEDDLRAVFQ